jgi:ketosteroid isomerase-like protein
VAAGGESQMIFEVKVSRGSMDKDVVTQLDNLWNEGYQRKDIFSLSKVLADDWIAFTPDNQIVTTKQLLEAVPNNPEARLEFDEFDIHVFGDTAITKGRLTAHHTDGEIRQQRFIRIFAKRNREWKAVTAQVIPSK